MGMELGWVSWLVFFFPLNVIFSLLSFFECSFCLRSDYHVFSLNVCFV